VRNVPLTMAELRLRFNFLEAARENHPGTFVSAEKLLPDFARPARQYFPVLPEFRPLAWNEK